MEKPINIRISDVMSKEIIKRRMEVIRNNREVKCFQNVIVPPKLPEHRGTSQIFDVRVE